MRLRSKPPLALILLLTLLACDRTGQPRPDAPTVVQTGAPTPLEAWSWHSLGSLAVIEGEVAEPTELILEGRSIQEHRYAEVGPVRWELFRPPVGEVAVLRTEKGVVLARFDFSAPDGQAKPAPAPPRLARQAEPTSPAPAAPKPPPPAPPPQVRSEARLPNPRLAPLPSHPAPALPSAAVAPVLPPTVRTEVRPSQQPVAPLQGRKPQALPSAAEAPVLPPSVRTEARSSPSTVPPLQGRKPLALPSVSEAPTMASNRSPALHLETVPPRPMTSTAPSGNPMVWPGMGEALNLTRGPKGHKRLVLSFDGGSSAEVATEVLDLLRARGVHTTLFLTGAFIQRFPALVKRMVAEGHEIGNHTMDHPHFAPGMKRDPKWTREKIQRELLDADKALMRLTGRPMDPYWRAPYGEQTAEIRKWAEELGYRHVGWSEGADTLDWATPKERRLYRTGDAIVQRLQQRLTKDGDGLIVLMHLGSARVSGDRPTDGLGAFMDRALQEGWTFVSAGSLLHDLGKPTWDPHQRLALLNSSPTPSH